MVEYLTMFSFCKFSQLKTFRVLIDFKFLPVLTASVWVVAAIATVIAKKQNDKNEELSKAFILIWMALIFAVVVVVLYLLYDANLAGNAERYGSLQSYLVFNDDWGNSRGWAWIRTMDIYMNELNIFQKLFGYGADTLALLMLQYYPPTNGVLFDSVHNEYLHFLVTVGFVGMASYIVLLGSSIVHMFKNMKGRPEVAAIAFALVAFAVQATVNINLPVAMPLIFQLLVMGVAKKAPEESK